MSARLQFLAAAVWLAGLTTPMALAQAPPAPERPAMTAQRISLDLKGVDILDVLKLLSQKSGLNFVAGRNVTGRVTLFVSEVDVWDAFELIISANDLAYERRGDIVTVMTARDYELIFGEKFQARTQHRVHTLRYAKGAQVAAVLNQLKSSIGRVVVDETTDTLILTDVPDRLRQMQELLDQLDQPTRSQVFRLNYAKAAELQDKVQERLSPIGTAAVDERTNTLVVSDLAGVLRSVEQLVQAFDLADGEVLIEARILTVELTDDMSLGVDWRQLFSGMDLAARSNLRVLGDIVNGTATGQALRFASAPKENTQIIIEALKKLAKTETLSNPRIMVANDQEAKILVGTKEAIVTVTTTVPATGSTVSSPEIEFVDVGTKLFVTPNVKPNGHIQLKIRPEVSTSKVETFQGNRIPIVSTTEAETTVLVKSGVTVIIGGLIETKAARTEHRVPVLSDLPALGRMFRGTTDTQRKSELVVFLTPEIINPDGSPYVPPELPPALVGQAGHPSPAERPEEEELPTIILQEPVPAAYRDLIRRRLGAHLAEQFRQAALRRGSVVVSFVLSQEGRMIGPDDITSSQGEPFILAARKALRQAEPFPPFPDGAPADRVRFRLAVEYAPD
jgi:type IV pilus assembly protein PilQ